MPFPSRSALGKFVTLIAFAVAFTACSGGSTPASVAQPGLPASYVLNTVINPPKPTSFDIGFVDETAHMYLLSDRGTNGIDVVNSLTSAFIGTAGAGLMQGLGTAVAGFARSPNAGPNGVVSLGNGLAAAGDGNSTLKIVNFATPTATLVATIAVPIPTPDRTCRRTFAKEQSAQRPALRPCGAGNFRVDEMGYDPVDNVIEAVSDNACPVFVTFFKGTAPYNILGQVALLTANGGGEQTVYDPAQGLFLTAIPSTSCEPQRRDRRLRSHNVHAEKRTAAERAVQSRRACHRTERNSGRRLRRWIMVTFNAVTGKVTNQVQGRRRTKFGIAPVRTGSTARTLALLPARSPSSDGNGNLLSNVTTAPAGGSHSVAVESQGDHVFVPVNATAGNTLGINVFARSNPRFEGPQGRQTPSFFLFQTLVMTGRQQCRPIVFFYPRCSARAKLRRRIVA